MQISEYQNIYKSEASHYYYVGTHEILLALISSVVKKNKPLQILDAGCGTGLFAMKLKPFGKVTGIDMSDEALKFARLRKLKVKKASITNLPIKENTFDLVVSNDVICHKSIKDDQSAVDELTRVLKPGGILVLKLPAFDWLKGSHDKHVFTKKRYTKSEVEKMLKKSNNNIIKSTYAGSFLVLPVIIKNVFDNLISKSSYSSVQDVGKLLNTLLVVLFKIECSFVSFLSIPFGITIITISRKGNYEK